MVLRMIQLSFCGMHVPPTQSSPKRQNESSGIAPRTRRRMSMAEFRKAIALGAFSKLRHNQIHLDAPPEGAPSGDNSHPPEEEPHGVQIALPFPI